MKKPMSRAARGWLLWALVFTATTGLVYVARSCLNEDYNLGTTLDWWKAFDRATTIFGYLLAITAMYAAVDGWLNEDSWLRRLAPKKKFLVVRNAEAKRIEKGTDVLIMLHHTDGPALSIINLVNPKVVILVTTNAENAVKFSDSIVEKRKQIVSDIIFNAVDFMDPVVVSNKGSSIETCERTIRAINTVVEKGYARECIVVDITGATKPMSIGAFEAADSKGIGSIYLESDYDSNGLLIKNSGNPVWIRRYDSN